MVKDLVAYAVTRLNIRHNIVLNDKMCPRVLFTRVKVNYKKELELAFGDYCEMYGGTNNTSVSRSILCIALYPTSNSTGSWEFLSPTTRNELKVHSGKNGNYGIIRKCIESF